MAFAFIPKELKFFDLFDKLAGSITKASGTFKELVRTSSFNDEGISMMRTIEHECDEFTHELIDMLNRSFITPYDREDIHYLAHTTDNVVDILYTLSKRIRLYKLNTITDDFMKFAELIEESTGHLAVALRGLRHKKNHKDVYKAIIEINRLENEGDVHRDRVVETLFENSNDPINIIKWKEIFEALETALDICEDVANAIDSILVKQA